jgi:hypothetical protein
LLDRWRVMIRSIVEDDEQPLAWIGGANLSQQLNDALGITRLPSFQADQVTVVGRISPNDVEAIPTRVGLQPDGVATRRSSVCLKRRHISSRWVRLKVKSFSRMACSYDLRLRTIIPDRGGAHRYRRIQFPITLFAGRFCADCLPSISAMRLMRHR